MEPIIDHLQTTEKDMSIAVPFYEKLHAELKELVSMIVSP